MISKLLSVLVLMLTFASATGRPMVLSGTFYTDDQESLKTFIATKTDGEKAKNRPRLLIVPHDRFFKSGTIAGKAYQQIKGHHYEAIILIGPYHKDMFEGAVVWDQGPWQTPWGTLPIHHTFARAIRKNLGSLQKDLHFHDQEHSLETQIPFLAQTHPKTPVVPILISHNKSYPDLVKALLPIVKDHNVLIIVSTDLSHYHPQQDAEMIDERTLHYIRNQDAPGLDAAIDGLEAELCGSAATLTGLALGKELGWPAPRILSYTTSASISGQSDWCVGYVAAMG